MKNLAPMMWSTGAGRHTSAAGREPGATRVGTGCPCTVRPAVYCPARRALKYSWKLPSACAWSDHLQHSWLVEVMLWGCRSCWHKTLALV